MAARLPPPLSLRASHVITENARVQAAVAALRLRRSGRDRTTARRLACEPPGPLRGLDPGGRGDRARLHEAGALGARIVGGGFGGHVLGLLPPGAEVPEGALRVRPAPGARLLD